MPEGIESDFTMNKIIRAYDMRFDYEQFRSDIRSFMDEHSVNMSELDTYAGVGHGNTSNILSGVENSKINTLLALGNAIDADMRKYFVLKF